MNVQIEELSPVKKALRIEIPKEDVVKAFASAYDDLRRKVKISGFRPGKVPRSILEKKFGPSVMDDVIKKLVPDYYQQAIEAEKLVPVEYPSFDKIDAKPGETMTFTATVEVRPLVTLAEYKGIPLSRKAIAVSPEDVEHALSHHQNEQGQLEACDAETEIAEGDFAIVSFEATIEGEPVKDGAQSGYALHVGKNLFPPPLETELIGKKKGDVLDVDVPYPDEFQNKAVAGKTLQFHIDVEEVKKKVLPELDDEFAKDLGHDSLVLFKKDLEAKLLEEAQHKQMHEEKRELVDKLIALHPFDLPSSMVARELDGIAQSFPDQRGVSEDPEKRDELLKELEPLAQKRVAESLILNEVAKKEEIEASDEDLEAELKAIAQKRGISVKEVRKNYEKEQGALEGLKSQLRELKTLDFIYKTSVFQDAVGNAAPLADPEIEDAEVLESDDVLEKIDSLEKTGVVETAEGINPVDVIDDAEVIQEKGDLS